MHMPDTQNESTTAAPDKNRRGSGAFLLSVFDKLAARYCNALLGRMDSGIILGSVRGSLPSGDTRLLGGHAPGPAAEMNIRSWRALIRIGWAGSVGLYDGWAAREWDSPDPVQIFDLFVRNRKSLGDSARASGFARLAGKMLHWLRRNNKAGSRRNIEFHYDLGNEFYAAWLDESMTYSSALFTPPISAEESLESAQAAKNKALLARLHLNDGDRLLEIGCGWGGLAEDALHHRDVDYHGITLSREQKAYADLRLAAAGFSQQAEISITDYRDVVNTGPVAHYDAIASVEMVEAVGQAYWPDYLDCIARNLKPGGRAAIQYIRIEDDIFDAYANSVDFIQRYIFPGGMLLSENRFRKLAEERGLLWCDQMDFGAHYAETLRRWHVRFNAAASAGRLPTGFDEKFVRLWRFYLMYCEGGFRGGGINVAQVTLIKSK
jgi:cyclopropane-fatty-acyl-phospholipid synthase